MINTSVFIVQTLGIFLVVVGLSMAANSKGTVAAIGEAIQNKGTLWTWGFIAVLVGAAILATRSVWTYGLPVLVTIIGWLALLKGALILIFPNAMVTLYKKFNKGSAIVFCGIVMIIIGLFLVYA